MELADYLKVVRRRWWLLLLATILGVGGAAGATYTQTPRYTASSQLLALGVAASPQSGQPSLLSTYAALLSTDPAIAHVAAKAGVTEAAPAVTVVPSPPFLVITVEANSGAAASAIANAYATEIPAVIADLEQQAVDQSVMFRVLRPAVPPSQQTSPSPKRNVAIGLVLGLILGIVAALSREALDARVRESAEVEKLEGVTLLGSVPKEHGGDVLASITRPRSSRAEAYRHVRTNLEFTSADGMPRSVVVTSPGPGEGKSSLSANLAVIAARSGRSVALVDADLRKPTIAKYFGLSGGVGLAEVLAGQVSLQQAMVPVDGEQIYVLTSGAVPKFPSELVGSAAMSWVIQELEQHFDAVIIDTPPVLPVSDALVIAVNAGGVVMVARMAETRRAALKRAIEAVRKVNVPLLGVVANAAVKKEEDAYGYGYGYGYGYNTSKKGDRSLPPQVQPAERRSSSRRERGSRRRSLEAEGGAFSPDLNGATRQAESGTRAFNGRGHELGGIPRPAQPRWSSPPAQAPTADEAVAEPLADGSRSWLDLAVHEAGEPVVLPPAPAQLDDIFRRRG